MSDAKRSAAFFPVSPSIFTCRATRAPIAPEFAILLKAISSALSKRYGTRTTLPKPSIALFRVGLAVVPLIAGTRPIISSRFPSSGI